jgi:hypothetical protein
MFLKVIELLEKRAVLLSDEVHDANATDHV